MPKTLADPPVGGRLQEFHKKAMAFVMRLERWEADLIEEDDCWRDGLPAFTQELYDRWMELQAERNALKELGNDAEDIS